MMDISLISVSPQAGAVIVLLTVAVIKLVDEAFARDWAGVAKIIGAAFVGLGVSFGVDGLTALAGIAYGLGASGLLTVVSSTAKAAKPDVAKVPVSSLVADPQGIDTAS